MSRWCMWFAACGAAALSVPVQAQLADSGFDTQGASVGSYCYSSSCPSGSWQLAGGAGFVREGDGSWSPPPPISGATMVFLQGNDSRIAQTITVAETGSYAVSFWLGSRGDYGWYAGRQTVAVTLGGQELLRKSLTSGQAFQQHVTTMMTLTAGQPYVLSFAGLDPNDNTAFLDSVAIVRPQAAATATSYRYDVQGRLVQASSGPAAGAGQVTSYSYDNAGNRTRVVVAAP